MTNCHDFARIILVVGVLIKTHNDIMMGTNTVCVLGGTGFVGRYLALALAQRGFRVRVLTRYRERHRDLLVVPRVALVQANVHSDAELQAALQPCDAVINLAGVRGARRAPRKIYQTVHVDLPRRVAQVCQTQGIARLLHLSALNASVDAKSAYLRSKGEGERMLLALADKGAAPAVTILRPAPIFGPEDALFTRFASLLARLPLVLPVACPEATLAPVWVKDVVQALLKALEERQAAGKAYDLCGPCSYRLVDLARYTAQVIGRRRHILPLNDRMSRFLARVLEKLPSQPFTWDDYLSLQVPGTCEENGLLTLGIEPTSIDAVVPGYLAAGGASRLYSSLRCTAGRDQLNKTSSIAPSASR